MPRRPVFRLLPMVVLLVASVLLVVAWWVPNRPQAGDVAMPDARFNSVSFSPYRVDETPLTGRFPSPAEVDQDLGLIAGRSRGIRSYAAIEGDYVLPALARTHGLKMWQGIWLGSDRASNAREIAAGIALARAYPDVIERVVVGNEVLLRKDLPVDELIADIDQVKHAVRQPVTYADVWDFFLANPQLVPHLDVVTIHILPYWEDHPTNIDGAIGHVADVVDAMQRRFPASRIAIGETCWPSRGRWRQDAAPSLVNEAVFVRRFVALAEAEHLDYNFFASFDQVWKYQNEGVVGASWGLWTVDRVAKFPLSGPVQENAAWLASAGVSVLCGWVLYLMAAVGRAVPVARPGRVAVAAMLLGGAFGVAWTGTVHVLFDRWALIAGIGNLAGQATLAVLFVHYFAALGSGGGPVSRTGRDATDAARALLRGRRPDGWRGEAWAKAVFDDLSFLFVWTAAILQLLLLYDPRYRDFPQPAFAVPVLIVLIRLVLTGLPLGGGGREEWVVGVTLAAAAIGGAIQEGPRNLQSLGWAACALLLAVAPVLRGWRRV